MSESYLATFAPGMSGVYLAIHVLYLIPIGLVDKFAFYFPFDPRSP